MKTIRCLIVDDEEFGRQLVRTCLQNDPELVLCGEASNARAAIAIIESLAPEVLFLDVQMPEINGLQLLQMLKVEQIPVPFIIFVTAYDKYAINAFEESAVDYLLKPFDENRFQKAISSAKLRLFAQKAIAPAILRAQPSAPDQRIPLRTKGGSIFFIEVSAIDWIEAEGNYLRIHMESISHEIRGTMASIEETLADHMFIRIHRSMIVNIVRVKAIKAWHTGEYIVYLTSGKELTLTRTYRDAFFERCKLQSLNLNTGWTE